MSVRIRLNQGLDRAGAPDLSATFASLTPDLAAAVAATPVRDRDRAFEEIDRALRSQVGAIDEAARDVIRSRPMTTPSAVASTRRPSREARVGLEDLEDRVIPSILTITVTNHPSAQVQSANSATWA